MKRIVIKIGTTLLTHENNELHMENMRSFVDQIAQLQKNGHEVVFVTSGAVASGRAEMTLKKESKNIPFKHALAAVGQGILMNTYREEFKNYEIPVAQALLTNHDFQDRQSYINVRNTLELLLCMGVLPIVNENDVTTLGDGKFSSNDILAAYVASMLGADFLLILSDIEGLYDQNPKLHKDAKLIKVVEELNDEVLGLSEDIKGGKSRGGMEGKLQAVALAVNSGVKVGIAGGHVDNIIHKIVNEGYDNFTLFKAKTSKRESRKNWLLAHAKEDAFLIVDEGAAKALVEKGKSLLPSGVNRCEGSFERGDVVGIKSPEGKIIALGQTNYPSSDIELIKGCHSSQIAEKLATPLEEELIHRDNMLVIA